MTDIVERLRRMADLGLINTGLMEEAANEIERLRSGLGMLVAQEYDAGYSPERYAEAVLLGHEP
jgi:hypothetical protein